jgi:ATP-dependent helicase/nuclease subunit B
MPVEILVASVGTGKTEIALQRLVMTIQQPFAQVWVLVSGKRQEDAFRQRLAEHSQQVYFNVEFFTFYQLYHRLLNLAQQPPRKLDDPARFGLLRAILEQLQREEKLPLYGAIAQTPGFVRIVAEFIYELKQNVITHENFLDAAYRSQSAKDQELALIYSIYQQKLIANHVVDREGEGWLALNVLQTQRTDIGRDVDLLIVDGYDQFTPLQAQLLMLLAERAQKALVTLTTVPGREETIGRRFKKALKRLTEAAQSPPIITEWRPTLTERRHPALRHLVGSIFQLGSVRQSAEGHVALIEAPDPAREASAVLRQVKRLLLSKNCQSDDILIALRDWQRYAHHFDTMGRVYGVPLTLHRGETIAENPAVIMLFNLVNLHAFDFRRRDLLDVLRSPYFRIPELHAAQIDQLERISQAFVVTSGRGLWLEAVARATHPLGGDEDDHHEPEGAILEVAQAASLRASLAAFFDAVTPPSRTTLENYVYWLDNLIGLDSEVNPDDGDQFLNDVVFSLDMPLQIKQQSAQGVVERDLAAMHELKRILRGLLSGQALLKSLGESGEIERAAFLLEIQTAVNNTAMNQGAGRSGRVLVTTVTDARGLPHKHVFIPGLSEGIFPAQVAEDPLYLDTERQALGIPLETQAERAADDGLFYELISLAQESLTLSRPTVQDGVPWIASHLWRGVAAVFSDVDSMTTRIGVGAVVGADEVISRDEAMLAVADGLSSAQPSHEVLVLYNWVMTAYPDHWERIHRARLIELSRASRSQPHDRYSGRLFDPDLIAYAARELSEERRWSASQLNDYGICGFRFFAKRLLKLEALEEPEEALDAAALGTINHEVLERAYREIARRGLFIAPENADEALTILRETAPPVLAKAPDSHGFRDSAKWEQEKKLLLRRLEQLIRQDFSDEGGMAKKFGSAPRQPYLLEAPFGTDGGAIVKIPIVVNGKSETLHLRGYIDRMDRVGDGVIVIDYKTGSTKIPVSEIEIGRNFQMMVYLRAAQYILAAQNDSNAPTKVAGGLFWHIRSQQASGELVLEDEGIEILELAEKYIGRYIAAGRNGDFVTRANKVQEGRCTHYCEYSQLCRMGGVSRRKPEA